MQNAEGWGRCITQRRQHFFVADQPMSICSNSSRDGIGRLHPVDRMPGSPDACIGCWRAWCKLQADRRAAALA